MQARTVIRDPRLWGTVALAFVLVLVLVAGILYVRPLGSKTVTFYTDDAASISPGMNVRIAGVPVGTVNDLAIEPDQVRVRATVNGDAFVGDQSQVQVRMLTVVGGYFVNIDSLGTAPLGDAAIPRERVVLPYSLIRTLADSTKITDYVKTGPINQSLAEVQHGLAGNNLGVVSSIVDAGNTLMQMLERQRGQLSDILDMSDEYLVRLSNYKDQFRDLLSKVSILEATLVLYGKGFSGALMGLGRILQGIGPLAQFYIEHEDKFLAKIVHWQQVFRAWADRTGLIVRILRRVRDRMETTLDKQDGAPELLATDLCIPVPGSAC